MLDAAIQLNNPEEGVYGIILAGSPKGPGIWVLSDFIYQAGADILDEEGNVAFDSPEGVHALQFMTDLVTEHQVRSEEHTSELQSRENLVCRLLLEKKN